LHTVAVGQSGAEFVCTNINECDDVARLTNCNRHEYCVDAVPAL
jgi:hypothetical protein